MKNAKNLKISIDSVAIVCYDKGEKEDCQNIKFGAGVKVTKKRAKIRSLGSSPF